MANNNPNQPREDDVVLGGHAPPLVDGVVLGGIEGVKMRLASTAVEQRVTALSEALKYGEAGLDLVIQGLRDQSKQVQYTAYSLLEERQEARIKKLLRNYLPWFEFEVVTVDDQGQEYSRCRNYVQYFEDDQGQEYSRCRSYVQYFEDDLGDGVSLAMVSIPGGTFMMGSPETENMMSLPETEKWRHKNESPQHQVTVAPFFMGKYPITQVQWQAVAALPQVRSFLDPEPSRFEGKNRPVDYVSWYDAVEFCARVSNKTGREYRLPSEAEWEYACRAGTTTPFHFGETITFKLANYRIHNSHKNGWQTTPVGHFNVANAFGLYDMHGNVCEWCADHWHNNYEGAPTDGSIWLDNPDSPDRLLRGGSWVNNSGGCRSAYRNFYVPGDRRNGYIGFRIVCATAWTS